MGYSDVSSGPKRPKDAKKHPAHQAKPEVRGAGERAIGVDEVGRGAWAGPLLVVAARQKPNRSLPDGLTDSKLLTDLQKEQYYQDLLIVCDFGEGWVEVDEIDEIGLAAALKLGAERALSMFGDTTEEIIIDGSINLLKDDTRNVRTQVKADLHVPIVSAASIYAKVIRDKHMWRLHYIDPTYDFKNNVGYGTAEHIEALKKHGVGKHHRKSFKPIMKLLK